MTPTSKLYLSSLKVPISSNHATCVSTGGILDNNDNDNNYNVEDNNNNDDRGLDVHSAPDHDVNQLQLAKSFEVPGDPMLDQWFSGIKHDPLKYAQKLVW